MCDLIPSNVQGDDSPLGMRGCVLPEDVRLMTEEMLFEKEHRYGSMKGVDPIRSERPLWEGLEKTWFLGSSDRGWKSLALTMCSWARAQSLWTSMDFSVKMEIKLSTSQSCCKDFNYIDI